VLAAVAALPLPTATAQQIYRCVDARGRVTLTDQPCPKKPAPKAVAPAPLDVTDARAQPAFLGRILAVARNANLADAEFVEKALAVRLVRTPGDLGDRYALTPASAYAATEFSYLVDKPQAAGEKMRWTLAFRVDQERACIRPDVVTGALGESYHEFDFGPTARPDVGARLRRIVYVFPAVERGPLVLAVTFERRREFCVDLVGLEQLER